MDDGENEYLISQNKKMREALKLALEFLQAVRDGNNRRALTRMLEFEAMVTYEKLLESN